MALLKQSAPTSFAHPLANHRCSRQRRTFRGTTTCQRLRCPLGPTGAVATGRGSTTPKFDRSGRPRQSLRPQAPATLLPTTMTGSTIRCLTTTRASTASNCPHRSIGVDEQARPSAPRCTACCSSSTSPRSTKPTSTRSATLKPGPSPCPNTSRPSRHRCVQRCRRQSLRVARRHATGKSCSSPLRLGESPSRGTWTSWSRPPKV